MLRIKSSEAAKVVWSFPLLPRPLFCCSSNKKILKSWCSCRKGHLIEELLCVWQPAWEELCVDCLHVS